MTRTPFLEVFGPLIYGSLALVAVFGGILTLAIRAGVEPGHDDHPRIAAEAATDVGVEP